MHNTRQLDNTIIYAGKCIVEHIVWRAAPICRSSVFIVAIAARLSLSSAITKQAVFSEMNQTTRNAASTVVLRRSVLKYPR